MVSGLPASVEAHLQDFTEGHYRQLLLLARARYPIVGYDEIDAQPRFLLWRHDCDFSLNRAVALAEMERQEGIRATYFVNPHSEFYNLLEKSQAALVRRILEMGHALGLHFDAAFHDVRTEAELDQLVAREAAMLHDLFGVRPTAFSFHNPVPFTLGCEQPAYGGVLNCYGSRFKSDIGYCSDSNGYWRHRRLHDVLDQGIEPRLQVLTHPDWWHAQAMHPRQRIHRAVYGRAHAGMRFYDDAVESFGRVNLAGAARALQFLRSVDPAAWRLCDYLWNERELPTLFLTLWRLHEKQARDAGVSGGDPLPRWPGIKDAVLEADPSIPEEQLLQACEILCEKLASLSVVNCPPESEGTL